MKHIKSFAIDVMRRYSEFIENCCIYVGEYVEEALKCVVKYGKYIFVGLMIIFGYIFLALTIPIWYLPYKYFIKK